MLPARLITFATYNVHGCVGTDGKRDAERVSALITSLDASVVGLQEVDCRVARSDGRSQLDVLSASTGMTAVSGPTILQAGGLSYGNALLTRFPVLDVKHIDVSFRRREPRGILSTVLDIDGSSVHCLVTHFGLSMRERRRQVDLLLKHVGDAPVVLMGDFNEWRARAGTLLRLHRTLGHSEGPRSFPSRFPVFPLDRIWVRPHHALRRIHAVRQPAARIASDHLPVCAEVDVTLLASG